ncbi:L-rhamnose/proton symporter RhaT [Lutibacter sp. A64]|uniref:L-rhamnose/proton symporter RhaT n=1 Tax=Lutibacter sp. A64 TaxID=2918526 RepID=UPI001F05FD35|nr:L-rhamnose/proton symporter RhaT [Lutibacter sp. A64]UMB54114.1 L-rhamnose/proton symporter RhaT [Lutibacter sp. A64]
MQALLGVLFHSIGGVASGSFYMPYNKVKGWAWETFWMVGGIMSWLILPPLAAWLTIPDFTTVLANSSSDIISVTFIMGLLWGVGGLTYGLGVRYLGMSLGNSVVLGFSAAFGALVPSIYYNFFPEYGRTSFTDMLGNTGGQLVLFGVFVCLAGIALSGKAGMMKESELSDEDKKKTIAEFDLVKGLVVAILSGILSSFFNFGIELGKPLADAAIEGGSNPLYANNITFVVILWGGLLTNFVWTTILSIKNKSYKDFTNKATPIKNNLLFSALAGSIWFLQFFFYGMGESKLGSGASSWILHMSTIILTANFWGIYRKEWNGVATKTKWTITAGIAVILLSVVLVGIGNSI